MSNGFVVRYGSSRLVAEFTVKAEQHYARHNEVIVRSNRGVEWGEVLCAASPRTREYLVAEAPAGRILRRANEQDFQRREEIRESEPQEFTGVQQTIAEHKLQMQLVDVEHLFGGERLIVYYLAEKRVDFRELVKALARQFKTRIEMRQIGVRDEAKLLADYGDCGKPVCCNTHLREMPPVSMKMAKLQKATLDPTKISGRCGRLKCCLRYEYDTYDEFRRELPRVGATVVTKEGQGRVIGQEILAKKVLVVYESNRRMMVDGKDILTVVKSSKGGATPDPSTN
ncbi:MAG: stage 0 sporulation family protein [Planctomycetaceae bacterium]